MRNACCVLVGAGRGLGLNVARRFANGGFDVALISRDQEKLDNLAETLKSEGLVARGFSADAGSEKQLRSAFAEITEWNDNIEVLIYNAAAMDSDCVLDITPSIMMEKMSLNLGGAICSVNQILPSMRTRGSGTILITGGGLGLEPYPDWTSLSAGKAALRSYAIALHKELSTEGIHVAVIAICGIVEPEGYFNAHGIAEEYWRLHNEATGDWRRELVFLPEGADPYYNDTAQRYRSTSLPISTEGNDVN